MQSEQQYQQLLMQYQQLKNGAEDIAVKIEKEDFDSAIVMIKQREQIFLSCKCMLKYLELTPIQKKEVDKIVNELRTLELNNIKKIEQGMENIQNELARARKTQRIQNAYGATLEPGNIFNVQDQ